MSNVKKKSTALDLKEMKKLFGPAPVLSSESLKDYDAILKHLMDCVEPRDFIEQSSSRTWLIRLGKSTAFVFTRFW